MEILISHLTWSEGKHSSLNTTVHVWLPVVSAVFYSLTTTTRKPRGH